MEIFAFLFSGHNVDSTLIQRRRWINIELMLFQRFVSAGNSFVCVDGCVLIVVVWVGANSLL